MLLQQEYKSQVSLFKDTSDEGIWDVAPWIFEIGENNLYKKWEDPNVSLKRCLIFETKMNLQDVKTHLQQFIYKKIDGVTFFNRFWDAKILKQQIERFETDELLNFFDDIDAIYMKEESGMQFLKIVIDKRNRHSKQLVGEETLFTQIKGEVVTTAETDSKKQTRKFFTE